MGKAPAFQFYVRDWLSDPQLRMASHSSKGIWADMLCYMWEAPERGKLKGTREQLARVVSATNGDFDLFIEEATTLEFADVTICNNEVTVCNRRMVRDEKERENTRLRVQRHRGKKERNGNVTPPSSSSTSSSPSKKDPPVKEGRTDCPHERIIALYHETLPELARVKVWGGQRIQYLRTRWREDPERQDLEWWRGFFEIVKASPFLMGQVPGRQGRPPFTASLPWLVMPENFAKVIEGFYLDRRETRISERAQQSMVAGARWLEKERGSDG